MAERIRTFEWRETSLGTKHEWPNPLVSAVDLMLASLHPWSVHWGVEATMLYNDAFVGVLGALHPGALGRPFVDGTPDSRERFATMLDRVMAGETVRLTGDDMSLDGAGATPSRLRDGEAVPIRDLAGRVGGSLIRWSLLEDLADATGGDAHPIREALDNGRVATWRLDLSTMQIGGDAAFFAVFGLPYSDGMVPVETLLDALEPAPRARLASALRAGPPGDGAFEHELTLRDGDGADRAYAWRGRVRAAAPSVIAGVMFDLAADRNDETLRLTEARLKLAHEAAGVGTFDWVIATNRNNWSAELLDIYGLQAGQFGDTYETWIAPIHADDRASAAACIEDALVTGRLEGEWRVVRPNGEVVHLMARGVVERDPEGNPLRMTGAQVDITDRVHNERRVNTLIRDLDLRIEELRAQIAARKGDF